MCEKIKPPGRFLSVLKIWWVRSGMFDNTKRRLKDSFLSIESFKNFKQILKDIYKCLSNDSVLTKITIGNRFIQRFGCISMNIS